MAAAAFPAPTTIVRPLSDGGGRCGGTQSFGCAAATAASNSERRSARGERSEEDGMGSPNSRGGAKAHPAASRWHELHSCGEEPFEVARNFGALLELLRQCIDDLAEIEAL